MPVNSFCLCYYFHCICYHSDWGNSVYFWENFVARGHFCWNWRIYFGVPMVKLTLILFIFILGSLLANYYTFAVFGKHIGPLKICNQLALTKVELLLWILWCLLNKTFYNRFSWVMIVETALVRVEIVGLFQVL